MSIERKRRMRQIRRNRRIALVMLIMLCAVGISIGFYNTKATAHQEAYKYYTNYIVGHNDTLWGIAEAYCSPEYSSMKAYIREVQKINNIGTQINYGQSLIIPYYSEELK